MQLLQTLTNDFNVFVLVLASPVADGVVVRVPPLHLHPRSDFFGLASDGAPPPPALFNTEIGTLVRLQTVYGGFPVSLTYYRSRLLPSLVPGPRCAI